MTLDFLLLGLVRSALVLAFAHLLMWVFRKLPAVQRVIGRSALLLGAGLFFIQPQLDFAYTRYTPYSTSYFVPKPVVLVSSPVEPATLSGSSSKFLPVGMQQASMEPSRTRFGISPVMIWATGAAIVCLWTLLGSLRIRQIRKRGSPVANVERLSIIEEPSVSTPFVAGLWKPILYVPTNWETQVGEVDRDFVLRHEMAHIAHRDLPWLYVSRLLIALCWPNPLFWLMASRLRVVSEALSDEAVLASGADASAYASCLLDHHQRASKHAPSVAFSTVGRRSTLSKRIETILANRPRLGLAVAGRTRMAIISSVMLVGCLAAVVFGKPQAKARLPEKLNGYYQVGYDTDVNIKLRKDSKIKDAWLVCRNVDNSQPPTCEKLSHSPDTVFVRGSGRPEEVAGLWVFMTNGDLAFASLWPRDEVVTSLFAVPTKTVDVKLVGAEIPAGGIAVGVDHYYNSGPGADQGESALVPENLKRRFEAVSTADGYVQLTGLPVNTNAYLSVRDKRYTIADRNRQLEVNNTRNEPEAIRILPASSVSGRALLHGSGVAGVKIVAQIQNPSEGGETCSWGETVSDSEGNFTIPQLSKGKYNVTAVLSTERDKEIAVRAVEGVNVPVAGNVSGINVNFEPATILQGTLRDDQGQALSGVAIGAYGPSRPESSAMIQSAITDDEGRFTFYVPSGKHRLYVASGEWDLSSKQVETVLGKPTVVNFVTKRKKQEEVVVGRQPSEAELKEMKDREKIEEQERKPTPAVMSFGPGKPFYGRVKLKSGVTIKLEFMQEMGDPSHRIWQPDGSPPTEIHQKTALPLGFNSREGDVRRILGYISFDKNLNEFPTSIVQVPQASSWNVYQSYGVQNDDRSINMTTFNANKTLRQTDMKFGVATGAWQVIAAGGFDTPANTNNDVRISQLESGNNSLTFHVMLDQRWSNSDVQMRAFDKSGKPYLLINYTPMSPDEKAGGMKSSFTFEHNKGTRVDLKSFSKLEFIARPYEWVTFKGIHLYPN